MSIVNVLFGGLLTNTGAQIGSFTMDVTLEEMHERNATITDSSVEDGSPVSDHIIIEPDRVRIEGLVTSSPVIPIVPLFGSGAGRVKNAVDALDELYKKREPFTLVTQYKRYDNMVIERLQLPRTREMALRFTAELRKVHIVSSRLDALGRLAAAGVQDRAAGGFDAGRQVARESSEATASRGSALSQILSFLGF